jgi:hypothetical protein
MTRTRVAALLTSTREVRSHHGEAWVGSGALEEGTPDARDEDTKEHTLSRLGYPKSVCYRLLRWSDKTTFE